MALLRFNADPFGGLLSLQDQLERFMRNRHSAPGSPDLAPIRRSISSIRPKAR